ncbi:MAG: type III pantothenate kinase [Lentimicrobiaceae bacterium]|nr:type III pantothenate kinase [Lentimicrobiaceae bacterium]
MNLIFDFGNTKQKMAAMSLGAVIDIANKTKIETKDVDLFLKKYNPARAIVSSVVNEAEEIAFFLKKRKISLLKFSAKTPIPIQNEYKTPETLGGDRLACAVAAASLFPKNPILVLQMGTCITSDFITESGVYKGGSISLGLEMRLKALHHFSAKLPLVACKNIVSLTGTTTEESILTGIMHGITDEINGITTRYLNEFDRLKIILTGGDAEMFKNKIKNEVVLIDNLVLTGLDIILNYNVENEKNK